MSAPSKGQLDIRVLADGTLRIETGDMSGVNHKSADQFLAEMARVMGGEVEIQKAEHPHHHHHDHDHTHDHVKGGH